MDDDDEGEVTSEQTDGMLQLTAYSEEKIDEALMDDGVSLIVKDGRDAVE